MAKCGLIGNPISHSKSPALFKAAYGERPHTYTLIEAPGCREAMERFTGEGFTGINVTSPFKDEVMQYISFPDSISSTLGSANTIILREGKLHSYNTDYYGVRNTLEEFLAKCPGGGTAHGGTTGGTASACTGEGLTAIVVGAGGAGKAAALAVKDMGMQVFFANRSSHAAAPFAENIGAEYIPLEKIPLVLPQADIIVYNLSMEIEPLRGVSLEGKIVFEANYAHPNLSSSGAASYIDGRYWLYNQAVPAFRLFTGEEPFTPAMKGVMGL